MKKPTKKQQTEPKAKPGPKPDTIKIEGDWGEALKAALKKKKPADGWPDVKQKRD